MKRHLLFIIFGATLLWSTSSHAVGDGTLGFGGGVNDNPHNLSSQSLSAVRANLIQTIPGKETQICIFCHTPHAAVANTPLWGRPDPSGTFNLFAVTSIKDSGGNLGIDDPIVLGTTHYGDTNSPYEYPNGSSKLCLSCHDGVTALGILANSETIDVTPTTLATRPSAIELATSHPISFIYNTDVQNYLNSPAAGKLDGTYTLTDSSYVDSYLRVQCTTCHQPHQDTRGTGGTLPFWRRADDNYDAVCAVCHSNAYAPFNDHAYP